MLHISQALQLLCAVAITFGSLVKSVFPFSK